MTDLEFSLSALELPFFKIDSFLCSWLQSLDSFSKLWTPGLECPDRGFSLGAEVCLMFLVRGVQPV